MEEFEEFKEFQEFKEARGARSQNPGARRRCAKIIPTRRTSSAENGARNRRSLVITDFLITLERLGSSVLERTQASWLLDSGSWLLLQFLELLELLRVVILARRLLSGCRQFWSIAWVPWVGFEMGVFQSPDLRITEAKDLIDL